MGLYTSAIERVQLMAEPDEVNKPRTRRALMGGFLGGLGAWAASTVARVDPTAAAAGDPIRMGRLNKGGGTSTTLRTTSINPGFSVVNSSGPGIFAQTEADFREGVYGRSQGTGVYGKGGRVGVRGDGPTGVIGKSPRRSGVQGLTDKGFAIHGYSRDPDGFAGYFEGKVFTSRFIEMGEIGKPQAPKADLIRLFARDSGSGKLQLCVRFPTGDVQVIATEQ